EVVAGATRDRVVARVAEQELVSAPADDRVVAVVAGDPVVAWTAAQRVAVRPALDLFDVREGIGSLARRRVGREAADDGAGRIPVRDGVEAGAAVHRVVALASDEEVVAR